MITTFQAQPGVTVRALARVIGTDDHTTGYHIEHLRRQGLLVTVRSGRSTHVFPGNVPPQNGVAEAALADPELARLMGWISDVGRVSHLQAVAHAGVEWQWPRTTTRRRLDRLVRAGALKREQNGPAEIHYESPSPQHVTPNDAEKGPT